MNDEHNKQSLSALLDNEADDLEIRRVLKACEQDPQLSETWQRYAAVQSAIHEFAIPVSADLSTRIAADIANEALPQATPATKSAWQNNFAKLAVAASVALVFIVGVQSNLENAVVPASVSASGAATEPATTTTADISAGPTLVAENENYVMDPAAAENLRNFVQAISIDEEEPLRIEHIQDSPLYRLVNGLESDN
jgi:negative regulator of sigma E activity